MNLTNTLIAKKRYSELLALTQLYLLREHKLTERCIMEKAAFQTVKPAAPTFTGRISGSREGSDAVIFDEGIALAISEEKPPSHKISKPIAPVSTSSSIQSPAAIASQSPAKIPVQRVAQSTAPLEKSVAADQKSILLEPINSSPEYRADLSYMQFFKEHFPEYSLSSTIPSDQKAQKTKDAWKIKHQILPVAILSFHEQSQSLAFLKNIAKAIHLLLAPTCVLSGNNLEKNQQWDEVLTTPDLRLIIASDYELYLRPGLMEHYTQDKQSGKHFLKRIPLLLLSDLTLYLKKPELKQLLWNAIRTEFI